MAVNESDRSFDHPLYETLERFPGLDLATTAVDKVLTWGANNSQWIFPMATSCCGIEFMAALPQHRLEASSTLRELYGVDLAISAMAHLLRGGRHKVVMDNLGCVFIMGGYVPSFATGGRAWEALHRRRRRVGLWRGS